MANIPPPPSEESLFGGNVPPPPPEHELFASKEQSPKFYEIEKQPGLPKSKMDLVKQVGRQFMEGASSPMPGSLLSVPIKAMSETANQAGADVARGVEHGLGTGLSRAAGFVTSGLLDPLSYFGGGLLKGAEKVKPIEQAAMKPGVEEMLTNLREQSAPLKAQIEEHTQQVMNQVDSVVKKYGDKLNDAKRKLGFPITIKEKEAALENYGNVYGLSKDEGAVAKPFMAKVKTPEDLAKKIIDFKKTVEVGNMPETIKVKVAHSLQDEINSFVNWDKSGTQTEGVLKSQYKDLKSVAIPKSLNASRGKMGEVLELTGELSKKLDEPGKAEAFLRNIVTSKNARTKDHLMAIRHLEELSGQNIFDKIAKAVQTEKATEVAIKQFEKLKPAEQKALNESGISIQDILSHKITGWTSVIKDILNFKDQIKTGAKAAAPKFARQMLINSAKGFGLSDDNKASLDVVMKRLKNAK